MAQLSKKKIDALITRIYGQYCSGMQIPMLRIPALWRMAEKLVALGADEPTIGAAMVEFVNGEKV